EPPHARRRRVRVVMERDEAGNAGSCVAPAACWPLHRRARRTLRRWESIPSSEFSVACAPREPDGKLREECPRRSQGVIWPPAGTLWILLLSRVVQGVGGGTVGVLQAYVADASRPEDRAKGLGWLSAATSAGAVVGPAFGSMFVQWWGHRGPGFGAAGFCVLSALFA